MRTPLSRRTALKGLGASIALPFLDAMAAAKRPDPSPVRAVFIGVNCGIMTVKGGFFPDETGPDYSLTPVLEPLRKFRREYALLGGLHHPNCLIGNSVVNVHGQDTGTLLTGANLSGSPGFAIRNTVSVDQVLAARLGERTRISSLVLASGNSPNGFGDSGYLKTYIRHLSWDPEGNPIPPETDPGAVFDRLFVPRGARAQKERERLRQRRKSILDNALDEARRLNSKLGGSDRNTVNEYLASIREVERRLERAKAWEKIPVRRPADAERPEIGNRPDVRGLQRLMLDVLALALRADVTRIATYHLNAGTLGPGKLRFLGVSDSFHSYTHTNGREDRIALCKKVDHFHLEQLAYFLDKLAGMEEAGGSVLSNSMVLYAGGLSNGPAYGGPRKGRLQAHGMTNLPVLLAGRGAGALKTGRYLRYPHGVPLSNLYVAMMKAMGIEAAAFGGSTAPLDGIR